MSRAGKVLTLAILVLAVGATTAVAAYISGNGTLVGTSSADTMSAGSGNDTVYGLKGADHINAGNGNDVVDGDGVCASGVRSGDYPNGIPSSPGCEDGQILGDGGDTITVGKGNDTVFGGGGRNFITAGCGKDTIYGGPIADNIKAGDGLLGVLCFADSKIYLGLGSLYLGSTVHTGSGDDVIHAQNGKRDSIYCAAFNGTTVYADNVDFVSGCAHVTHAPDPNPGPNPRLARRFRAHKHHRHARARH